MSPSRAPQADRAPPATVRVPSRAVPTFECSSSTDRDGATLIRLNGELDLATAPELDQALSDAMRASQLTVVDLSGLEFMDSAGVHTIVEATAAARLASRRLVLVPGLPALHTVFGLTGTQDLVEFADAAVDVPAVDTPMPAVPSLALAT